MPRCANCYKVLYPAFFTMDELQPADLCVFCHRGADTIYYGDDKSKEYHKDTAVKEYDIFLKMLSEQQGVKDIIDLAQQDPSDVVKLI
jgi:hypothetical protein